MRTLCISYDYPWPPVNGHGHRLFNQIEALGTLGEVDFFGAVYTGMRPEPPPPRPPVRRWALAEVPSRRITAAALVDELIGGLPRRIQWRDWSNARRALQAWVGDDYDLIWFAQSDVYISFRDLVPPAPQFVDFDNLEDRMLRSTRRTRRACGVGRHGLHGVGAGLLDRLDERRWRLVQQAIGDSADAVALCSELDKRRFGADDVFVLANGYDPLGEPVTEPPAHPTMTMIGNFVYRPNLGGARYAAEQVLPRVRATLPGAELRLVGRHEGTLDDLARRPGVTVVGEVPDVAVELRRARVMLAPLFAGSGTRVKVLESFAYGVPVVTTPLGCEGIEAEPGRDLLVGDDAAGLADHCVSVLADDEQWHRLSKAGYVLWDAGYRWSALRSRIVDAAARAAARRPGAPGDVEGAGRGPDPHGDLEGTAPSGGPGAATRGRGTGSGTGVRYSNA